MSASTHKGSTRTWWNCKYVIPPTNKWLGVIVDDKTQLSCQTMTIRLFRGLDGWFLDESEGCAPSGIEPQLWSLPEPDSEHRGDSNG